MSLHTQEPPPLISPPGIHPALRVIAGLLAILSTFWGVLLLYAVVKGLLRGWEFDWLNLCIGSMGCVAALMMWDAAFLGGRWECRRRLKRALWGGLICGGIGFACGFFGPMIFAPEANQGPLLGIFITGPGGFVLGVLGGWIYGWARRN